MSLDDLGARTADLVAIDSTNAAYPGGPGEAEAARMIAGWLRDAGHEVRVEDVEPGRPNVVAVRPGTGGGPSLLLTGHTDTVPTDAARPGTSPGRVHGRGSCDMQGGVVAALAAFVQAPPLAGDLVFAAVCDEEVGSIGTRALVESGLRLDRAIVTEPTDLAVGVAHRGFVGFELETPGVAAHGSRPDLGEDAILAMAPVLQGLQDLDRRLQTGERHPLVGTASLHAGTIDGGTSYSTYPASCTLTAEWRTLPQTADVIQELERIAALAPGTRMQVTHTGAPFEAVADDALAATVAGHAGTAQVGLPYWADSAVLAAAGVSTVLLGPVGGGMHGDDEWVDVASLATVRDVLVATALDLCGPG